MGLALQKLFQKGREAGLKLLLAFVCYMEKEEGRREWLETGGHQKLFLK